MAEYSTKITIILVDREGTGHGTITVLLSAETEKDPKAMAQAFVAITTAVEHGLASRSILGNVMIQCQECCDFCAENLLENADDGCLLCPECRKDGK